MGEGDVVGIRIEPPAYRGLDEGSDHRRQRRQHRRMRIDGRLEAVQPLGVEASIDAGDRLGDERFARPEMIAIAEALHPASRAMRRTETLSRVLAEASNRSVTRSMSSDVRSLRTTCDIIRSRSLGSRDDSANPVDIHALAD